MITITEHHDRIMIKGHAGYAPKGYDIVCAAVSVLTETLGRSLSRLSDCSGWFVPEPGNTKIVYKAPDVQGRLLIDAFFIGVEGIAERYPENVRVIRNSEFGMRN